MSGAGTCSETFKLDPHDPVTVPRPRARRRLSARAGPLPLPGPPAAATGGRRGGGRRRRLVMVTATSLALGLPRQAGHGAAGCEPPELDIMITD